jgi:hypothetical protein
VKVYRQEVFEAIQAENRAAAQTANRSLPDINQYLGEGETESKGSSSTT